LFRPLHHNGKQSHARRAMDPDAIDRVVRNRPIGQPAGGSGNCPVSV
jgi:hypothetical protein